jgi:hypothetical protein
MSALTQDKNFKILEHHMSSMLSTYSLGNIYYEEAIWRIIGLVKGFCGLAKTPDESKPMPDTQYEYFNEARLTDLKRVELNAEDVKAFYQKRLANRQRVMSTVSLLIEKGNLKATEAAKIFIEALDSGINTIPELLSTADYKILKDARIRLVDTIGVLSDSRLEAVQYLVEGTSFNATEAFAYLEGMNANVVPLAVLKLRVELLEEIKNLGLAGIKFEDAIADLENIFSNRPSAYSHIRDASYLTRWPLTPQLGQALLGAYKSDLESRYILNQITTVQIDYLHKIYNFNATVAERLMSVFSVFKHCRLYNACPESMPLSLLDNHTKALAAQPIQKEGHANFYATIALLVFNANIIDFSKYTKEQMASVVRAFNVGKVVRDNDYMREFRPYYITVPKHTLNEKVADHMTRQLLRNKARIDMEEYEENAQSAPSPHNLKFLYDLQNWHSTYLTNATINDNFLWKQGNLTYRNTTVKNPVVFPARPLLPQTPLAIGPTYEPVNINLIVPVAMSIGAGLFICRSLYRSAKFFFSQSTSRPNETETPALTQITVVAPVSSHSHVAGSFFHRQNSTKPDGGDTAALIHSAGRHPKL